MLIHPTELPDVLVIEPRIFKDERGFFMESYNQDAFNAAIGRPVHFVQDNHSLSNHAVLRGLHYQLPPRAQSKLVRAVSGRIFDVAVDMRESSPTFGRWTGVELSAENHRQLWVPEGFAHGFLVLSDYADVIYKTTDYYSPSHEASVRWDDPDVAICWPGAYDRPLVSQRDASAKTFSEAVKFR